ncbi:disease resistance protein L6-like [Syzygium oleosum]|uniref:disease resistance protein L6-like n=1 Tax=Syzygium oleosum TaxID=219896 RepID=UPI0024BA3982|nr:disease resistance protein L6-like [Syzygium oleosum]XP_056171880.1 disease resistance protein L6-like [Syzygium oleosum]XP_056171881.1 disease resistance protein L6-like [Syzygium oleosum]XP_056171882.1 disease resistance protein L6-like [Syzygium oleosum]XP_056171883.1 disease resistance protein L6-like [Syzygium oleosum]XP_056171884.1 disease resistance protein L6-like [Syzygium oleosum]XP_056171885.1 disease resistance protein L6-like [Syzygium oleosum]XP_056171886.1 disease resistanc
MHRPLFGRSFAVLVAPILLSVIAFNFLTRKKSSVRRNAEGAGIGEFGSSTAPTETNSGASSSSAAPTETNNVPSASLNASAGNCYDVFLSFRGPDTRDGFTDHLYTGLVDAGIRAFRDDDELRQGEEIGPDLLAAIKNSKISIPILSVNYGSSKWCLDELVQIMECKNNNKGHIVLPIFYKVEPAHVRHQIGDFGEAFRTRSRRFDPTILKKWEQALVKVSSLKGWEAKRKEGELVKLVIQKVLSELKKEFELVIPEYLVGIDGHVEEVMKFIGNHSSATKFIGIHGMGGIGKTTLAKTIYNKLSNQFEYRSFIVDIRELCQCHGLEYLQNQLLYDISNQKNQVTNKDEGTKLISLMFKDKKVLILLDDVDDHDQLKALAGDHNWFSSGSRILITTRNSSIFDNVGVDYKYEHKEMDKNDSMVLFCRHAFRRSSPPSEFEDLARDVIATTGGLPLSLEVLGSTLCGKKPEFWRGTIDKLKRVPHKKVREKLKISYEVLDYEQKQIFLDIACFFIGTDKRIASYMWDACGFFPEEGIEVLRFMSLIKLGDDHELRMHDQLRDLGRDLVHEENQREPQYRSRLWDSKEVQKVLKENKGTDKIEAIDMSEGSSKGSGKTTKRDGNNYTAKQFKNLTSLRFLQMKRAHLSGDFENSIEELKWLRWQYCPVNFKVKNFHVTKLVVLKLSGSKINDQWEGWSSFMTAENLKYLDLTDCDSLENTIFLSAFKHLEVLILENCRRLKQIDPSIGDMKALLRLDLMGCQSLRKLPAEIESLENLEILNISETRIKELPKGIGSLRKLQELCASYCIDLKGEMPESMCNLSSLQLLDVLGCLQLQSLPDNLPSSVTDLSVTCGSRKLPSLSHLTHLKRLRVYSCGSLECIEVLPSTLLKNSECSQPTDIEESELPQSLNTPFELEFLYVRACQSIKTMDVSQFIHLRTLNVAKCQNLVEVRGLELDKLIYLESLTVYRCGSIEKLLLPKFKSLKTLDARKCKKLAEIQGLDGLEFLEILDVSKSDSIKRLDLPKSGRLKILDADACENLAEIQGLDRLEFLESLVISECASIERLDLPKSGRLKTLNVEGCKNLAEIQGLNTLEFLEELRIGGCESLQTIPELFGVWID